MKVSSPRNRASPPEIVSPLETLYPNEVTSIKIESLNGNS